MTPEIEHTHLLIRELNLHVAQVGKGERVLCSVIVACSSIRFDSNEVGEFIMCLCSSNGR
jgi:hypothetical protein